MKKSALFALVFLLIFPVAGISGDFKQEKGKQPKIEETGKKHAREKASPERKRTQKRMQKSRIKNHNEKKTNNMWKK
jgi:hypothetical protein